MSGAGECFSIGSIVACKTCFDETVEGEVLAFDPNTKMLILKCRSKTSQLLNDVSIMNLQYCSDVQVLKEASSAEAPQPLNLHRIKTRLRNSVDQRQRWISSRNAGVSIEGQNLFMAIGKTLDKHVTWEGHNIIVFNEVTITPPYKKENVSTDDESKINSVNYVKKLIDQNNKISQGNNATDSSLSLSSSSSISGSSSTGTSNAITSSSTNVGTSSSPVPTH